MLMLPFGVVDLAIAVALIVALFSLQMLLCAWASRPEHRRAAYVALAAQAGLIYLPLAYFQETWLGVPGLLAGSVLLLAPGKLAWFGFSAVIASVGATHILLNDGVQGAPGDAVYMSVTALLTGLIVYGLSRFRDMVGELAAARTALVDAAVTRERLRLARDLHDLLGYSLSAMALKAELADRLIVPKPDQARQELADFLQSSRQALADVRSVTHGYRDLSLEEECRSVRSVLESAGVDLHMEVEDTDLPVEVGTVAATVLREGVTNLLRHSKAENCEITIRGNGNVRTVTIANDGAEGSSVGSSEEHTSSGLGNLSERAAALGGWIATDVSDDGWFRLSAELPLASDASLRSSTSTAASTSVARGDR
ncbi:histidine kinase [Lipingzhangella sp. LS1_29]|uniref:Histidine kinase n=2 Tax=Lipingzhangella rawalii TaxID=2055835 RepID=A0ABU2H658_9ACTN|nr:histidine kinase [Lipingzhangella rawalii]